MKSVFTKILSFVLAFALLFGTTSFSLDIHYCGDKLIDMSFLGKAQPCRYMSKEIPSEKCLMTDESCCSNIKIVKKGNDEFKQALPDLNFNTFTFINTFFYSYINLFEGLEEHFIPFDKYTPPILQKDIQVLHETFLI